MIGIVCTYYNRQQQLINTLFSFRQYNPQDFFVVVVDDTSRQYKLTGVLPSVDLQSGIDRVLTKLRNA